MASPGKPGRSDKNGGLHHSPQEPGSARVAPYTRGIDILLLCTANMCRSPMAEGLLRHRLEGLPGGTAHGVHVHSAGNLTEGQPATADAVAVVAARGVDLSAHRSRKVTADLVRNADLVVGMSRRHVAEACVVAPEAFPKAFTLKELVRRGEDVGPRKPGQSLDEWLREVHWGRNRQNLLGRSREDDIADPVNHPRAVYEKTAAQLESLLDRMVDLIWGKQEEVETNP